MLHCEGAASTGLDRLEEAQTALDQALPEATGSDTARAMFLNSAKIKGLMNPL